MHASWTATYVGWAPLSVSAMARACWCVHYITPSGVLPSATGPTWPVASHVAYHAAWCVVPLSSCALAAKDAPAQWSPQSRRTDRPNSKMRLQRLTDWPPPAKRRSKIFEGTSQEPLKLRGRNGRKSDTTTSEVLVQAQSATLRSQPGLSRLTQSRSTGLSSSDVNHAKPVLHSPAQSRVCANVHVNMPRT